MAEPSPYTTTEVSEPNRAAVFDPLDIKRASTVPHALHHFIMNRNRSSVTGEQNQALSLTTLSKGHPKSILSKRQPFRPWYRHSNCHPQPRQITKHSPAGTCPQRPRLFHARQTTASGIAPERNGRHLRHKEHGNRGPQFQQWLTANPFRYRTPVLPVGQAKNGRVELDATVRTHLSAS